MACVPCRNSKLKCDGGKPTCERCSTRDRSCYWVELDGRSTEAKKRRRSSSTTISATKRTSVDQLELLANAAIQGSSPASYPSAVAPNLHLSTTAPSPFGGTFQSARQSEPPFLIDNATQLPAQPMLGNGMTYNTAPAGSYVKPAAPIATSFNDFIGLPGGISNQQMWWERGGMTPLSRRTTQQNNTSGAAPSTINESVPGFDLASLGLEPQYLTDDMVGMLTGKVVWIDQVNGAAPVVDGSGSVRPDGPASTFPATDSSARYQQVGAGAKSTFGCASNSSQKSNEGVVRIQYFRLMGPTGISPGIKKITMELKLTPSVRRALFDSDSPSSKPQGGAHLIDWERLINDGAGSILPPEPKAEGAAPADESASNSDNDDSDNNKPATKIRPELFDGDVPARWVVEELIPIFFDRLGDHYLCLDRRGLEVRLGLVRDGVAPAAKAAQKRPLPPMLINAMCALAARFSSHPHIVCGRSMQRAHTFGKRFARKATEFLATSLVVPSSATVLAFIMMAWHEFACNLDSAFWNYGGMALRMAIDLGLQRYLPVTSTESDLIDDGLLFWAVYMMDRHLCVGTGRPTSIKDREITCPQPDDKQMLFAGHIRHVRIGGRIAETINAVLAPDKDARKEIQNDLDRLEAELIRSYESVPTHLRLNSANFKASKQKHLFFEFHLWFHNLLLILNRSPIVEMRTSVLPSDAVRLVRKSVQRCADVLAMDDRYDNEVLKSVPMANQTLFLAGCAELDKSGPQGEEKEAFAFPAEESEANRGGGDVKASRSHLMLEAQEGYRRFADALERISVYWDGVRWIRGVLSQRRLGRSHTDLVELAVGLDALVSKHEMRLLKRHGALSAADEPNRSGDQNAEPSTLPTKISNIDSLEELTSLLPQVQSALAAQYVDPATTRR